MSGDVWWLAYAAIPLAYDAGRAAGVTALAEALAELNACPAYVRPVVRTWEQQVADRAGPPRADDWPGLERMTREQRTTAYRALLDSWEPPAQRRAAA